jgi:hypothetical protein
MIVKLNALKALSVKTPSQSMLDLHQSLGHPSLSYLKKAYPDVSITSVHCHECNTAKMHQLPFSVLFLITTKPLECIHMDLW